MSDAVHNVLIVGNKNKDAFESVVSEVGQALKDRGIESQVVSPAYFKLNNREILSDFDDHFRFHRFDLIIAIGGDGTFLYTARTFLPFGVPVMGINLGRLGFLMEVNPEDFGATIDSILAGKVRPKRRMLLDVQVTRGKKSTYFLPFLNDAVISKGVLSRMVEMQISLSGHPIASYRADGLIVSTPTGSTAYNLAAGGPIVTPDMEAILMTPICPHSLGLRPIVIGSGESIGVRILQGEADTSLTIDGQENFSLKKGDDITITRAKKSIEIYGYGEEQFFAALRGKLSWNL